MQINLDWLQINVRSPYGSSIKWSDLYTIVESEKGTPIMKKRFEVFLQDKKIADVMTEPIPEYIESTTIFVKFQNWYLYQNNLDLWIGLFLEQNNLNFHSFTRFDIAADFNRFYNGTPEGLHPRAFIKLALNGVLRKVGDSKAGCNGRVGNDFEIDYLVFGKPSSTVQTKLYNKSLEMQEVKLKEHILQRWKENPHINTDEKVWRLEFAIRGNDLRLSDVYTGETQTIKEMGLQCLSNENLFKLWCNLQFKYFRWKVNDEQENITRMQDYQLFNPVYVKPQETILTVDKRKATKSSRFDRIIVNQLCKIYDELYNESPFHKRVAEDFLNVIQFNIQRKQLQDWAIRQHTVPIQLMANLMDNLY